MCSRHIETDINVAVWYELAGEVASLTQDSLEGFSGSSKVMVFKSHPYTPFIFLEIDTCIIYIMCELEMK